VRAGAAQNFDDVGEVVFLGRIIGPDLADVRPELGGREAIDAGIYYFDRKLARV